MANTTFILDLTRASRGAEATIASCRDLDERDWDLLALWSEAAGAAIAQALAANDERITGVCVGSGTGVCDWLAAVQQASGTHVVFLSPGDCLRPNALALWRRGLTERDHARWVLGAAAGAAYNDWWFQRDLSESAAALLLTGAAFPECTAMAHRDLWLEAAAQFPEAVSDASRAGAWLALASLEPPALLPEIVSSTEGSASQLDADTLVRVLDAAARRYPAAAARLMADVSRMASGMRIAQDALFDALRATDTCFRPATPADITPDELARSRRFFLALLARGERSIWIRGTGSLGAKALAWCRTHSIPVAGFLNRDHRDAPASSALVVVASMFHQEIAADLTARGWREGVDFVVFGESLA